MSEVKRKKHPDRVALWPEAMLVIDEFIGQFSEQNKGVKITRRDLINWFVTNKLNSLTESDKVEIAKHFYDEERFLKQVLVSFRKLKSSGEEVSLDDLLKENRPSIVTSKKRGRKRKSKKIDENNLVTEIDSVTGENLGESND